MALAQQVRYAATEIAPAKSARARGAYLRVSFKNTRETAQAINGWKLTRAVTFLENVQNKAEAVPMRRYAGGTGRCAQGTNRPVCRDPCRPATSRRRPEEVWNVMERASLRQREDESRVPACRDVELQWRATWP